MSRTSKYVVFSPYFGKLPLHFDLWLESCSYNKAFRFVVFTDDYVPYDVPDNVELINISFDDFRKKVQEKFDFSISLDKPYKLCDFKPTYGYVFPDYAKGCEYWGHCDLDLIFGDLESFLPDAEYDKISHLGSFCLYKNIREVKEAFMLNSNSVINYRDILSNAQNFAFDEVGDYNINEIFKKNGYSIYDYESSMADVVTTKKGLFMAKHLNNAVLKDNKEKVFIFDNGKVYSYDLVSKVIDGEYSYVHFQKRRMQNDVESIEKYIIAWNGFFDFNSLDDASLTANNKRKFDCRWARVKMVTVPRRIKKELAVMQMKKKKAGR